MSFLRARARVDSRQAGVLRSARKAIAVLASLLVVGSVLVPVAANADDMAGLTIQKDVSKTAVMPGETFNWIVEVGCSVLQEECINAQLIDTIPSEFVVGDATTIAMTPALVSGGQAAIDVTGQIITVDFAVPLSVPSGQVGLDNQIVTITIPVTVRTDLPYTPAPITVTNTATVTADNAGEKSAAASTSLTVPLQVATTAQKTFDPSTVLGAAGSTTTVTVGGTNVSNSRVDSFVIQDPKTPEAATGIFATTLRVDSLGAVIWPAGAETAVVSVWDAATATWVDAPPVGAGNALALPTVASADIRAVRIAFSSTTPAMQTGETASFELGTVVRAGAGSGTRTNTSTSTVSVSGSTATADATKALTLQAASSSVEAGKTIAPDRLSSVVYDGQDLTEATVTLSARNSGSVPLTTLTIAEPSTPSDLTAANPLAPAHPGGGLTFQGFGAVTWPTGATAAQITYHYGDGSTSTASTTTGGTLPAPEAVKRVTGFEVTFTGASMPTNSQATLPFTVKTNPDQAESRVEVLNRIGVTGVDTFSTVVTDDAHDDAIVYGERLALSTKKSLTRTELLALPGQQTTATLTTDIAPYPQSSRAATRVIQYDPPAIETGLTEWYKYFDPTALVITSVPGGATLTVQYRDAAGNWNDVPGMAGLTEPGSPHTLAMPAGIRDAVHGIRLLWDSPSGFVPGSTLTSNLTYQLRSELRGTSTALPNSDLADTLINCSSAAGWIGSAVNPDATADSPTPCPHVDLVAVDPGPGGGGLGLAKQFRTVSGNTVNAAEKDITTTRSGERTGVRLGWSTGGRTGVESMTITDAAVASGSPAPGSYAKGMYDAFNLYRINAISSSLDPYFQYDEVAIELYSLAAASWVNPAGSCTVATPCTSFGGYTLSDTERADTLGVRFIFTERDGRTTLSQPAGAGVAASTGNSRGLELIYEIRDTLRSNPAFPVVDGPLYNAGVNAGHSVIRNDAHAGAVTASGSFGRTVADTIELRDQNLALNVTKSWTGGPLPLLGNPAPTSRVTLRTINQTPATTVSELTILEPNPDTIATENPFERFNLARIYGLTHPAGATGVTLEVRDGTGATILSATGTGGGNAAGSMNAARTTALGWSSTQLQSAESVLVRYAGRIVVDASAQLQLDLAVRSTLRTAMPATPVTPGTVDNGTKGSVSDLRFVTTSDPANPEFERKTLTDIDRASIQLEPSSISVIAGKSFSPSSQPEGVRDPITTTLTGKPGGTERVSKLVLTDDRATFWNAFNLINKGAITLPTFTSPGGAAVLQVEVCTGAAFDATVIAATPAADCAARGGAWQGAGTWITQAQLAAGSFLPTGVTASDVTGVRLTVKRSDGAQWENPHAPTITINLSVQRRVDLRSGGAVPSEYAGNTAAPGESAIGRTTNGVTADLTGIWGGTASDVTTAGYRFVHRTTSVQVNKLPVGLQTPGVQIPYELTVLNTGQLPIENPVITDTFPTDAAGAMLIFNPDAPTTYAFTVSGGSVPSGSTPIPSGSFQGTTPSVVTITPTTDATGPTKIEFAFPTGTVIGVGQTVKVRIPLFFRPGLAQATVLENAFEVKGDRLLDACTAPSGSVAGATTTSAGYGCTTSSHVTLAQAPSLRAFIAVQALETPGIGFPGWDDANSQFTGETNEACRAAQIADGFSRPPCAPQTIPGQDSTWRLTVQNTGTTELSRLVVATRLPAPGDQTIVSDLVRNSQWTAEFNGEIAEQFGAGTTVQTFYTTQSQPCVGVLDAPSDVTACGTDPVTGWAPLPAGDPSFDPSVVTGLQFVVDYPGGARFLPGEIVSVDIGTTTVADLSVFRDGLVSNPLTVNSLSVSGISPTAPIPRISALDYSRSILSLATGSVTLAKTITGAAASFIPDGTAFRGGLVCTTLGEQFTRPFQFTVTGGVIAPASITFDNLPGGADCTVTETAASGQTGYTATTVTVDPLAEPTALPSISLINDYQLAGIQVGKVVTTTAQVIPTAYAFTASCTFLGVTVPLAAADSAFTLDAGQTRTITGIPANAECTVVETNAKDADATIATASTDAAHGGSISIDNTTRTVVFSALSPNTIASAVTNTVEFDNRFDAPAILVITKHLEGGAAAQFGEPKTFSVHAYCTFGATVQYDGDLLLSASNGWQATLDNLIAGSECTFTEPDLQGADAVVITPSNGVVTVPDTATPVVNIAVTNWYLTGAVQVTKVFAGDDGAIEKFAVDPDTEFEFQLQCVRDGIGVTIPGGELRMVTATSPVASYTGLASGAECAITETETGGASAWRVLDANGDSILDAEFTVTVDGSTLSNTDQAQPALAVENTFRFAEVSATKSVRSTGFGTMPTRGTFEVELLCVLNGQPIDAAEPGTRTIADGETVTWTELAEGAECTVTETKTGGAVRTDWALLNVDGDPLPATEGTVSTLAPLRWTGDPHANGVQFVNTFELVKTGSAGVPVAMWFVGGGAIVLGWSLVGLLAWYRRRTLRHA